MFHAAVVQYHAASILRSVPPLLIVYIPVGPSAPYIQLLDIDGQIKAQKIGCANFGAADKMRSILSAKPPSSFAAW